MMDTCPAQTDWVSKDNMSYIIKQLINCSVLAPSVKWSVVTGQWSVHKAIKQNGVGIGIGIWD